jgi:hypothetical protein
MNNNLLITNNIEIYNILMYFLNKIIIYYKDKLNNIYFSGIFFDIYYFDGKDIWNDENNIVDIETCNLILHYTLHFESQLDIINFICIIKKVFMNDLINFNKFANSSLIKFNKNTIQYNEQHIIYLHEYKLSQILNFEKFISRNTFFIEKIRLNTSWSFCDNFSLTYENLYKDKKLYDILNKFYKNIFAKQMAIDYITNRKEKTYSGIMYIRDYTTHSKTLNYNLQKIYFENDIVKYNYRLCSIDIDDVNNIPIIKNDCIPIDKEICGKQIDYFYNGDTILEIQQKLNEYIKITNQNCSEYFDNETPFYCYRFTRYIDPSKNGISSIIDIHKLLNTQKYIQLPYFLSTYSYIYTHNKQYIYNLFQDIDLDTAEIDNVELHDDYDEGDDMSTNILPVITSKTDWLSHPNNIIMRIKVYPALANFVLLQSCISCKTCYFGNENEILFTSGTVLKLISVEKVVLTTDTDFHYYKYLLNCEMLPDDNKIFSCISELSQYIINDKYIQLITLYEQKNSYSDKKYEYINKFYSLFDDIYNDLKKEYPFTPNENIFSIYFINNIIFYIKTFKKGAGKKKYIILKNNK